MSASTRKSCTRCKHVNCTCRSGPGEAGDTVKESSQEEVVNPTLNAAEEEASLEAQFLEPEPGSAETSSKIEAEGKMSKMKENQTNGVSNNVETDNSRKDDKELKVGQNVLALWRVAENDWREVTILEKNKSGSSFYVHWVDFNRRLDSWIDKSRIDLDTTKEKLKEVRDRKRKFDEFTHENHDDHEGLGEADLKEHEELTKVKNVNKIQFGKYILETWYFSPLPREIWKAGDDVIDQLYMCEFALNFYKTKAELERHQKKNTMRHPPGDEIYRNGDLSVFEVDGEKSKIWCQNLCYLAKMFLDHKYLYYDVDPFFFYVVCECDSQGFHIVGYFSKEKESANGYNLACILTLPQHQRKGYGKFIINFSYALSKIEKKHGSPEKPLSDLGRVSYESFWARTLLIKLREVSNRPNPEDRMISIEELADATAFTLVDIKATLDRLQILQYNQGQHYINANPKIIDYHLQKCGGEGIPVDPSKIHWTPHLTNDRWLR
uniref:Histone acetyltransferase n=1 Tax=Guillardia theta TaxID=55529 RepID=A0A7S4P2U9_GUITH|mmetsp:Transcript_41979/g.132332  ORF Transcript_41979/g.132332 Transcript_41979/m.132332 type:complete len:493 (+) Transcript_41979:198-1676(+)